MPRRQRVIQSIYPYHVTLRSHNKIKFEKTGSINQKFGARYHSSVISDLRYYGNVYKYVYRNPVEANLCSRVQDYPYSSLNFILGRDTYRFPVFDTYFEIIDDHWSTLNWLNTTYGDLELKKIRIGLQKTQFLI